MRLILLILFVILFTSPLKAQRDSLTALDTTFVELQTKWYESHFAKESIAPLSLAFGSLLIISIPNLKEKLQHGLSWNSDLEPNYINLGDDYIRYLPTVSAYALSAFGFKSKHRLIDRTVILAISYITSDFVVFNTKKLTKSPRPNGRTTTNTGYSFPSQHTAMAFVAATFLDHELGYISPWISVGGYLTAGYVGYARVARDAHWTSDVLMGAAVGIVTTHACYLAYDGVLKLFPKNLTMVPIVDSQQKGFYLCYHF